MKCNCTQACRPSSWQWHSDSLRTAPAKTLPDVWIRLPCPFMLSLLTSAPSSLLHFIPHHLSQTVDTLPFQSYVSLHSINRNPLTPLILAVFVLNRWMLWSSCKTQIVPEAASTSPVQPDEMTNHVSVEIKWERLNKRNRHQLHAVSVFPPALCGFRWSPQCKQTWRWRETTQRIIFYLL